MSSEDTKRSLSGMKSRFKQGSFGSPMRSPRRRKSARSPSRRKTRNSPRRESRNSSSLFSEWPRSSFRGGSNSPLSPAKTTPRSPVMYRNHNQDDSLVSTDLESVWSDQKLPPSRFNSSRSQSPTRLGSSSLQSPTRLGSSLLQSPSRRKSRFKSRKSIRSPKRSPSRKVKFSKKKSITTYLKDRPPSDTKKDSTL